MMIIDVDSYRVARGVVTRLAPNELIFFEAAYEAFSRDPRKWNRQVRRGRDPLAFGLNEVITLITPVALAVSAAVMDDLASRTATAAVERGKRTARWLRGKFVKAKLALPQEMTVELERHELERIRTLAREKARALGLPEEQIELFVDALIGSLALPPEDEDEQGEQPA